MLSMPRSPFTPAGRARPYLALAVCCLCVAMAGPVMAAKPKAKSRPQAPQAPTAEAKPKLIPARRVVLVHGIFQNEWRCFGVIRRALESRGVECLAPSLRPCDGRSGLPDQARQLKEAIDGRFSKGEHFTLIAFSMGGLVSRYYLQEMGGAKRCDGFFTISTPHHGTPSAWFYPGLGAKQMRPSSKFLAELDATENRLGKIPCFSYRTKADMVVKSSSSIWDRAENMEVKCSMHRLMTACPEVRDDILSRIKTPVDR